MRCPACTDEIPDDSRFCGLCGFRLSLIPVETHQERAKTTPPLVPDEPIPLTRIKPPSSEVRARSTKQRLPAVPVEPLRLDRPKKAIVQMETADRALAYQPTMPDTDVPPFGAPGLPSPDLPVVPALPPVAVAATISPTSTIRPAPEPVPPASAVVPLETPKAPRTATDPNNRRCPRFPLKVEVSYTSDHNFFTGFIQNIGEGGLFVATHMPGRIGEVLEVSFSVPGLQRVCTAICRVRWIREYNPSSPDSVPGMGLQFAQLDSDVRAAIDLFIGHREPIFYDD
jgi:uncharacterized protein (TIGR02266 family)